MSWGDNTQKQLSTAIQDIRIEGRNHIEQPHNPDDPIPLALFEVAREALGILEVRAELRRMWKGREYPQNANEAEAVDRILATWRECLEEWGEDNLLDYYEDDDLQDAFVHAVWSVVNPAGDGAKGDKWNLVWNAAINSFKGTAYRAKTKADPRAVALIKAHDLRQPHMKLVAHVLYQSADAYGNDPFPIVQEKLAEAMTEFFKFAVTRSQVGHAVAWLKAQGLIEVIRKPMRYKCCALYKITPKAMEGAKHG